MDAGRSYRWILGGRAWLLGIRAGDAYERWDSADGGTVGSGDIAIDVPDRWPPLNVAEALVAVGLLGASLMLRRSVPALGALGLLAAVLVAGAGLPSVVPVPFLVLALVAPAAAALLLIADRWDAGSRVSVAAAWLVLGQMLLLVLLASADDFPAGLLWDIACFGSLVVLLMLAAEVAIALVRTPRVRRRDSAVVAMLRSTAFGQRTLRAVEEEQRDQLAQRIRDRLLPRVSAGLRGLEAGDTQRSEQELRVLESELRREAMAEQLVVLRDAGLGEAIREAIEQVQAGPTGRLAMHASPGRPPAVVEVAALRIAQEAIHNVVAHASADTFVVRVVVRPGQVHMEVIDDGIGIDHCGHPRARAAPRATVDARPSRRSRRHAHD